MMDVIEREKHEEKESREYPNEKTFDQ